jgi:hypothetical protein
LYGCGFYGSRLRLRLGNGRGRLLRRRICALVFRWSSFGGGRLVRYDRRRLRLSRRFNAGCLLRAAAGKACRQNRRNRRGEEAREIRVGRKPHIFRNLPQPLSAAFSCHSYRLMRCYYRKNRWVNATEDTLRDITFGTGSAMLPSRGVGCQLNSLAFYGFARPPLFTARGEDLYF